MTKTDPRESLGYQVADLHRLFGRVFDRRVAHRGDAPFGLRERDVQQAAFTHD